jgi:uncharacterized protein YdiU (UPF0061 family)
LGLKAFVAGRDEALVGELLSILSLVETDMTIFFRRLALVPGDTQSAAAAGDEALMAPLMAAYYQPEQLTAAVRGRIGSWLRAYTRRVGQDETPDALRRERMNAVNPEYVLRNYLAQQAIDKAEAGDFAMVSELLDLLRRPYDEQPGREAFAQKRPEWARHRPGCSMLSCSS